MLLMYSMIIGEMRRVQMPSVTQAGSFEKENKEKNTTVISESAEVWRKSAHISSCRSYRQYYFTEKKHA